MAGKPSEKKKRHTPNNGPKNTLSPKALGHLVQFTEIGGIATTFVGVLITMSYDPVGGWIAMCGIFFTTAGVIAQHALSRYQQKEKDATDAEMEELKERLNHPGIVDAMDDWYIRHQDDCK